jgi:hypothetical protein
MKTRRLIDMPLEQRGKCRPRFGLQLIWIRTNECMIITTRRALWSLTCIEIRPNRFVSFVVHGNWKMHIELLEDVIKVKEMFFLLDESIWTIHLHADRPRFEKSIIEERFEMDILCSVLVNLFHNYQCDSHYRCTYTGIRSRGSSYDCRKSV